MEKLSASIVSAILITAVLNLVTFAATYIKPATAGSNSRELGTYAFTSRSTLVNNDITSFYSAGVNRITSTTNLVTLVSTSEEIFTSTVYRSRYPITTSTYTLPSPHYITSDIQRTTTVTQSTMISDSPESSRFRVACNCNTEQANTILLLELWADL